MIEWHHQLNGHKSEQTPTYSEGQGSLACCNPWGHKELDMTQQLNNNENSLAEAADPEDNVLAFQERDSSKFIVIGCFEIFFFLLGLKNIATIEPKMNSVR